MAHKCVDQLTKLYKGVDKDVLETVVKELNYLKENTKSLVDFKNKAAKLSSTLKRNMALEVRMKAENAVKVNKLVKYSSQKAFKDRPEDAMRSMLDGIEYLSEGGNKSIGWEMKGISDNYKGQLGRALEDKGIKELVMSGKLDKDIYIARHAMANKLEYNVDPNAKEAAGIISNIYKGLQDEMELAGSSRGRLDGYLRRKHSALKIEEAGVDKWGNDLMDSLDLEKTFGNKADDMVFIGDYLNKTRESIVDGSYNSGAIDGFKGDILTLKSHMGLDKKISRSRKFYFKNGEAEFKYMEKYGDGNILENVLKAIESDSRNAATFNRFGTNPKATWETLKMKTSKSLKGNPKAMEKFKAETKSLDALFHNITTGYNSGNSAMAKWSTNARSLATWSKLGSAVITAATTDIATHLSVLKSKTGQGLMSGLGETVNGFFKSVPKKSRKELAKHLYLHTDNSLGEFWSRFAPDDKVGGVVGRINNGYFRWNGMKFQNDVYKTNFSSIYATKLQEAVSKSYAGTNDITKANLARYGIGEPEFKILQGAVENVEGMKMVTPYAIDQLDIDPKLKRELRIKATSYISENAERLSSPTPSHTERTRFVGTTDPDSISGQLIRFAMQFKNFALAMHTVNKHVMMSDPKTGARGLKDVMNRSSMSNLAGLIAGTTMMGATSIILKDMAKGKTPRDMDNKEFWLEALAKGGGASIYFDFLSADYNNRFRSISKDILGPVLGGTLETISETGAAIVRRESGVGKVASAISRELPFKNLFYVQGALDYFIMDEIQEKLNPGYKARKRQNMMEKGQEPLYK